MIKALMQNGKMIRVNDYNELLEAMASFTEESIEDYMKGVTRRCKMWDGSEIKYSNIDEFVSEMLRVGVIKKIVIDSE